MHVARADGSPVSLERVRGKTRGEEEGKGLDGRKQTEKEVEEEEEEEEMRRAVSSWLPPPPLLSSNPPPS